MYQSRFINRDGKFAAATSESKYSSQGIVPSEPRADVNTIGQRFLAPQVPRNFLTQGGL
jgi:hypothetical protein